MNLKAINELEVILNQYIAEKPVLNQALNILSKITEELASYQIKHKNELELSQRTNSLIDKEKEKSEYLLKVLRLTLKDIYDIDLVEEY